MKYFPSDTANTDVSRNILQHEPKVELPPPADNAVSKDGQQWSGNVLLILCIILWSHFWEGGGIVKLR